MPIVLNGNRPIKSRTQNKNIQFSKWLFQLQCLTTFVIVNFSLPDNVDDYENRQLCIGVLPSGDKICDNKKNSKKHCKVTFSLFCCLRVGYCIYLDAILLTQ